MKKKIEVYIDGQINSRELYDRLRSYEPCVIDIITQTFVCVAVNIDEKDCKFIEKVCREYGECEVIITDLPVA